MPWWAASRPATAPPWRSTRRWDSGRWAACRKSAANSTAGSTSSSSSGFWSVEPQHLARIHPVVGIERPFDQAHDGHGRGMLLLQAGDLARADAMLPGAGAAHGEGAMDHAVVHRLGAGHLARVIGMDDEAQMEIAVAHMADEGGEELRLHH